MQTVIDSKPTHPVRTSLAFYHCTLSLFLLLQAHSRKAALLFSEVQPEVASHAHACLPPSQPPSPNKRNKINHTF